MSEAPDLGIVIVGAGIGGIAAAIELQSHGFRDITILERDAGIGGTWRQNTYPGCACDVPSHLYSFSYAQRRDWSRLCSPQEEILDYLEGVARDYGVDRLVRTGVEVTSCAWDADARRWTVGAADGRTWTASAVIVATGQLHQPSWPSIPGLETFQGHSFHSAQWDHDYDLHGKRVAVIGTGASAAQLVPTVVDEAAHVSVFQRTGNWYLPRRNRPYPGFAKLLFERVPGLQALRRRYIFNYTETVTLLIRHPRTFGRLGHLASTLFMRHQIKDPDLRRRMWPDYTFGCKRILFTSYFLPAIQQPNAELVTDRITAIDATGIVTGDGTHRDVDCIIYGTGFKTSAFMFPMEITGAGGTSLRDVWADGAHAHMGIAVPDFPSLFFMYGPNTNTSGGSIIAYEEAQSGYIRQALQLVRERDAAAIEVRREVEAASDREVQARFAGTAWMECDSWYRDEHGRIVTNWPGYMREYFAKAAELDPDEYALLPQPDREEVAA
jgi:cation diffusion facilitator CzcD-associated flavoprotein CzcO